MYASNEHEFQQEGDWIFLHETPSSTNILDNTMSSLPSEKRNSNASTCDSSIKSVRSDSSASVASHDPDYFLISESPVSTSQLVNNNINDLLSASEIKDEVLPCELVTKLTNENETIPVINEYDLINNVQDISDEPTEPETHLRQRTSANNIPQTTEERPISSKADCSSSTTATTDANRRPKRSKTFFGCCSIILICMTLPIFYSVIISQKSTIDKLKSQLETSNKQNLQMEIFSVGDLQQKLTQQFEERFQNLNKQFTTQLEQERSSFVLQINELHLNLTNTILHLTNDNHQLKEQIIALEKQSNNGNDESSEKVSVCETSTMDELLSQLIKQTSTTDEKDSTKLTGLFEKISASVSDFIENGQEYVEESKRKLTGFAGSKTAEQIQETIRRGVKNLSSSIRKAQSTYVAWVQSRAEQREQARKHRAEENAKTNQRPWRWAFQRGQDREHMRHQTPPTRKQHSSKS